MFDQVQWRFQPFSSKWIIHATCSRLLRCLFCLPTVIGSLELCTSGVCTASALCAEAQNTKNCSKELWGRFCGHLLFYTWNSLVSVPRDNESIYEWVIDHFNSLMLRFWWIRSRWTRNMSYDFNRTGTLVVQNTAQSSDGLHEGKLQGCWVACWAKRSAGAHGLHILGCPVGTRQNPKDDHVDLLEWIKALMYSVTWFAFWFLFYWYCILDFLALCMLPMKAMVVSCLVVKGLNCLFAVITWDPLQLLS